MTSNLVSMDLSEEVNNNNQDKSVNKSELVLNNLSCSSSLSGSSDTSETKDDFKDDSEDSDSKEDTFASYILNENFRIKVSQSEEWLCVARMPRDFSQTEFEKLLQEFGPIQQCFLIHSEITGNFPGK